MTPSIVKFQNDASQASACEALADEIASGIPGLAEARNLSPSKIAQALWLALFYDLVGDDVDGSIASSLFSLTRHSTLATQIAPIASE